MARFFVDKNNIHGSKITVVGEDVIHISKVLRMRPGEELTLCNGEGIDFLCKIEDISKKEIICSVISEKENESESRIPITIYQSMPKGAKIDYVIQKCVELGAARIVTFQSARSVAKGSKTDRLSRIALEAAKQLGKKFAEIAVSKGIKSVVFDRNGYIYHGKIKAFADSARENGLEF